MSTEMGQFSYLNKILNRLSRAKITYQVRHLFCSSACFFFSSLDMVLKSYLIIHPRASRKEPKKTCQQKATEFPH